ncbi:membrane dipeptidase [Paenibacillus spiritus]|uniref:Membrane dipeptidase n=1 Tax=Paenibacillus spiritus TaxID=2496557 RepID=A0A5J5GG45_9BACL|nr:dipeptidase [Paenibacillus spiritus]KAA9006464.1 membrane dipeptidase [Paenibacillus spiritus]
MPLRSQWPVADLHCDVLSKLARNPELEFADSSGLDVTLKRMRQGGVSLQCFAVFVLPGSGSPRLEQALRQIECYRREVIGAGGLRPLCWREEAAELNRLQRPDQRWALLSLEGADCLEGSLFYAEVLYELGVRLLSLTWNGANWAADGIGEERGGGLTAKGKRLVEWCSEHGMLLDVSHLSERGFWEVAENFVRPIIASHSNARAGCRHRRNLEDDQIRTIAERGGLIGLNFFPWFVTDGGQGKAEDLIPHIERICELGGERSLAFGSDFDGIDDKLRGLEHPGRFPAFLDLLLKRYPENAVRDWSCGNAVRFLSDHLPSSAVNKGNPRGPK